MQLLQYILKCNHYILKCNLFGNAIIRVFVKFSIIPDEELFSETAVALYAIADRWLLIDIGWITELFHGAFATGVACQQGTPTLPDTWFRIPFWTYLCSNCWDQFPRTCYVLTLFFTLNTPWYFLDFDCLSVNIRTHASHKVGQEQVKWQFFICILLIAQLLR